MHNNLINTGLSKDFWNILLNLNKIFNKYGKTNDQTLPKETRALGSSSRWYVASFAMAVMTKHRSLDCDDLLKTWLVEPRVDSCLKPRRLHEKTRAKMNVKGWRAIGTKKYTKTERKRTIIIKSIQNNNNNNPYLDERFSYKSNSKPSKSSRAASLWGAPPPPCSPMAQHNCNANSDYKGKK